MFSKVSVGVFKITAIDQVFNDDELLHLHTEMRVCRQCLDAGHPITPGAVFSGPASARVMIIGQAPGMTESQVKRPFNGTSGTRLFQWLTQTGWDEADFRIRHYMTAVTKCYPGKAKGGKGDRAPSRAEQKLCRPFLDRELALVAPEVIVPVGRLAIELFYGRAFKLIDVVGTSKADGQGRRIVPLPHPSGASLWLNRPEHQAQVADALTILRQLKEDLAL
jgi:uracil-DNA glycosylase family 4